MATQLIERKLVPDWTLEDFDGQKYKLWDFRQKSHLILVVDPISNAADRLRRQNELSKEKQKWDWLRAKVIFVKDPPGEMTAGVYFIDRWGIFFSKLPLENWSLNLLEREITYYEAKHC